MFILSANPAVKQEILHFRRTQGFREKCIAMKDSYGREIDYFRIAVTDKCNLRCIYCRPEDGECPENKDILGDDEIVMICRAAAGTGIRNIRITGGEPLMRAGIPQLIRRIANIDGIQKVSMTTNGVLLKEHAEELAEAGLAGVNVSLDTLDAGKYAEIAGIRCLKDCDDLPGRILSGIDMALAAGLLVKTNTVLTDINRDDWAELVRMAENRKIFVRFIELMPIGKGRELTGIPNTELKKRIEEKYGKMDKIRVRNTQNIQNQIPEKIQGHFVENEQTEIKGHFGESEQTEIKGHFGENEQTEIQDDLWEIPAENIGSGPAVYYHIPGFAGYIGFISALHGKFCNSCNRIRLTSSGILKPCLCYDSETDLHKMIMNNASFDELENAIKCAISKKPQAHCFEDPDMITEKRNMVSIGG